MHHACFLRAPFCVWWPYCSIFLGNVLPLTWTRSVFSFFFAETSCSLSLPEIFFFLRKRSRSSAPPSAGYSSSGGLASQYGGNCLRLRRRPLVGRRPRCPQGLQDRQWDGWPRPYARGVRPMLPPSKAGTTPPLFFSAHFKEQQLAPIPLPPPIPNPPTPGQPLS